MWGVVGGVSTLPQSKHGTVVETTGIQGKQANQLVRRAFTVMGSLQPVLQTEPLPTCTAVHLNYLQIHEIAASHGL